MNAVLLHPLGPLEAKGLAIVYATAPNGKTDYSGQADFFDWRDQARSFTDLVGWRGQTFLMAGSQEPARAYGHRVSAAVVRLVAGEGLRVAMIGVGTGLVCAVLLNGLGAGWLTGASTADTVNQWLRPGQRQFLFGLNVLDPLTFAGVAAILIAVAFAASYFPARCASCVDPIAALRTE